MCKIKKLFSLSLLMLLAGCSLNTPNPVSGIQSNDRTISIAFELPCDKSNTFEIPYEALAFISGDGFATIEKELSLNGCSVSGIIPNIPSGTNRLLEIKAYNLEKQLIYFGEALVDVEPGKTVDVQLKLSRANGLINVTGIFCDITPEPREFELDEHTLALYHFNEPEGNVLLDESGKWNGKFTGAKRVQGFVKGGLHFQLGDIATFDTIIENGTPNGTLELYFKFDNQPQKDSVYLILGSDGSRCNLVYRDGYLVFLKNHSDIHKNIEAKVELTADTWYHVACTWGKKGMRLFLNRTLIAMSKDCTVYESSPRTSLENIFYIGFKTYCCMEGIGVFRPITFEGYLDEIRISDLERY